MENAYLAVKVKKVAEDANKVVDLKSKTKKNAIQPGKVASTKPAEVPKEVAYDTMFEAGGRNIQALAAMLNRKAR